MTEEWMAVLVERIGHTLVVTLNRPDQLNAFDLAMRTELRNLWQRTRTQDVRAIAILGAGRAFCAGADAGDLSRGVRADPTAGVAGALDFLPGEWLEIPTVVGVHGACAGGGLHFVADADLVIASDDAFFTDPHVSVGQVSGLEPVQLVAKLPLGVLSALALLGRSYRLPAAEAQRLGLVIELTERASLRDRALTLATTLAEQSPEAVRRTRRALRGAAHDRLRRHLAEAWESVMEHWDHPDAVEGPAAFLERRPPRWHTGPVDGARA